MAGSKSQTPLAVTPSERNSGDMPSVEELREERVRLLQQIRHHKDEQDSIALDIENQPGAAEVYRAAARVQHAEHFAHRCQGYVEEDLPDEIACIVTADTINSEKKLAVYIKELQRKRDHVLKKISEIQDRFDKPQDPAKWYKEAVAAKYETKDENDKRIVKHTLENQDEIERLEAENSNLRSEKSAASAKLIRTNKEAKSKEEHLKNSISKTQLANTFHARQCRELNVANSSKTNNLMVLMNQLSTEHYGIGKAPTSKELPDKMKEAIENADQDTLLIEPKDVTEEDIQRVQDKKGKKHSKKDKEKKDKKKKTESDDDN